MQKRITQLQKKLSAGQLDAILISDFYNILYLTGFSGVDPTHREAFVFVTQKNTYLLTNSLYMEEAEQLFAESSSQFAVIEINQEHKLASRIADIVKKENCKTVGFEQYNLTFAEVEKLKKEIDPSTPLRMTLEPTEKYVEDLRMVKDNEEIAAIKKACKLTDETFTHVLKNLKVGVSEKQIAWEIEKYIKERGGTLAFSPIVAFGANSSMPHYKLTANSKLRTVDMILLDFGAKVDGYCSDMTRVVFAGKPTREQEKMYTTVLQAQEKVLSVMLNSFQHQKSLEIPKQVRDDTSLDGSTLDKIARESIETAGFTSYPHSLGHGVGLEIHEGFRLHYKKEFELKPNMVFSIEPGIYQSNVGGVRIEDLVLLEDNRINILSQSPKEMIIL